ncbi:hypothetical protein H8959_002147, partial [Pygathrix nigripes]
MDPAKLMFRCLVPFVPDQSGPECKDHNGESLEKEQAQDVKKIEKFHSQLMRLMVAKESRNVTMET